MLVSIEFKSQLMTYFDPAPLTLRKEQLLQLLRGKEEVFYQFCMSWLVPSCADHVLAALTRQQWGTRHPLAVLWQLAAIGQVLVFGAKYKSQREKKVMPQ